MLAAKNGGYLFAPEFALSDFRLQSSNGLAKTRTLAEISETGCRGTRSVMGPLCASATFYGGYAAYYSYSGRCTGSRGSLLLMRAFLTGTGQPFDNIPSRGVQASRWSCSISVVTTADAMLSITALWAEISAKSV